MDDIKNAIRILIDPASPERKQLLECAEMTHVAAFKMAVTLKVGDLVIREEFDNAKNLAGAYLDVMNVAGLVP